jgi:hypothetical protein
MAASAWLNLAGATFVKVKQPIVVLRRPTRQDFFGELAQNLVSDAGSDAAVNGCVISR